MKIACILLAILPFSGMKHGKIKQFDPKDVPDSHLNDHDELDPAEYSKLRGSIEQTGINLNPGFVWKGKTICGKHRRKAIIELNKKGKNIKFQAYELPDNTTKDEIIDRIDQDNLIGRDFTDNQKIEYVRRRFADIVLVDNRVAGTNWHKEYQGKRYNNVNVYISVRSGIPLRSIERYRAQIRRDAEAGKRKRYVTLDPRTERTVNKWVKDYAVLEKQEEKLKKEMAAIRDNFKGIPGGFKRFYS